ncbi:MAG: ABC transporter permease [Candidatus Acidiferrales bacterium]
METLWQDIRYAVRMLARSPGFAVVAVLTLALGIGANTAIFSVLDAVLLRSLPVKHPEQLVTLTDPDSQGSSFGSESGDRSLLAHSEYEYLRDHNEVFSDTLAADSQTQKTEVNLSTLSSGTGEQQESAHVNLVSGNFFSTLGVTPAIGRTFTPEVDRARGASPYAVISYGFWQRRFGLNPSVIGSKIRIHKTSFEIIGVAQPGFFGITVGDAPDIWVPLKMQDAIYPGRDLLTPSNDIVNVHMWLQSLARLKPGVTPAQAKASINVTFKQMLESEISPTMSAEDRKESMNQQIALEPGARGASELHGTYADPIKVLMALVGLVLLIACANVANLLLARGAARRKEIAVRLAIGARRSRLIRQLLTESLLLALLGSAVGILLAQWADSVLLRMVSVNPGGIQLDLRPDFRIMGFTLGVAILTAILFGLLPALRATRLDLSPILKGTADASGGETARRRLPATKVLVVAQVAVSLILMVAAGLFVHSLKKLSDVQLGYNREKLLLFDVDPVPLGYKGPAAVQLHRELLAKFAAIPGVRAVTYSKDGLFSHSESGDPVSVEGYTPKSGERMGSRMDHIGPDYFSTIGIPILLGREIGLQDNASSPRVADINQEFAKHFFPNTNPIGKHVRDTYPGNPGEMEVVGVVANAKYNNLREVPQPRLYAPAANPLWEQPGYAIFEVRTAASPAAISASLREAIKETNPNLPAIEIHTMSALVDESLNRDQLIAQLSGAFGFLALLLASIGLYGVMAYTVARRTHDIGIRMALGAQPGNVLLHVLRETLLLVLIGIGIGVPMAMGGARLVSSMLFGLGAVDPLAIGLAVVVLAAVAALAGFLPARRASRVDPMVALRYE